MPAGIIYLNQYIDGVLRRIAYESDDGTERGNLTPMFSGSAGGDAAQTAILESISFGNLLRQHTIGGTNLPAGTKAVFFNADGTCSIEDAGGGNAVTGVPFVAGAPLPFVPGRVTAMSGATKCFYVL